MPLPPDSPPSSAIRTTDEGTIAPYLSFTMRDGPLPPADELAAYSEAAQALILHMAEREQVHRHARQSEDQAFRREKLRVRQQDRAAQRRQIARGQYLGFSICALFLLASVTVALLAASAWGQLTASLLGGIGLSSLVFVFMRGRHPKARPESTSESRTALPIVSRAQSN